LRRLTVVPILVLGLIGGSSTAQAHKTTGTSAHAHAASCAGAVSWKNARRVIGRYATIRGRVAGTKYASSSNGSPTFLNIGVDYPSSRRVTVVIWGRNRARFGAPETRYRGRTICARGYVDTYRGVPEIEARSPSQIRVVN
jgi:DNA/RNA endonuclease YhcR with UshA esterase domain